jgi:hypothetical protein
MLIISEKNECNNIRSKPKKKGIGTNLLESKYNKPNNEKATQK